jgi:hypothetical protein
MRQLCQQLGFAGQAFMRRPVFGIGLEEFDGDGHLEGHVQGPVNNAGAAPANTFQNQVFAQLCAGLDLEPLG